MQSSFLNKVGPYGSEVSPTSIFNVVGKYGSEVGELSAFNQVTNMPPHIVDPSGAFVAFLTRNQAKYPRVDPLALVAAFSH